MSQAGRFQMLFFFISFLNQLRKIPLTFSSRLLHYLLVRMAAMLSRFITHRST
jgi:hypothetical protein